MPGVPQPFDLLQLFILPPIIFEGSFHYFKPVSCWILFSENVTGIPEPFDQLPSRMSKVNTFKTLEMRLYFDSDI